MNDTAIASDILTNSRLRSAKTCLRKHQLGYELGIRPDTTAAPLRIGTVAHKALELYYATDERHAMKSINFALEAYDINPPTDPQYKYEWDCERAMIATMLTLYFWRWEEYDKSLEWESVEFSFEQPIVNPETGRQARNFTMAGKIDGLVMMQDGKLALVEHKTTSDDIDPTGDYWRMLRMDPQISTYWLAAVGLGHPVQTVLYDVIHKPGLKPKQIAETDAMDVKIVLDGEGKRVKTASGLWRQTGDKAKGYALQTRQETPDEYAKRIHTEVTGNVDKYFARVPIPRLQSDLEEHAYDVWGMQKIIRECQRTDRWPRNTHACKGFGLCPYFALCGYGFDVEEFKSTGAVPEGFKVVGEVHQEL